MATQGMAPAGLQTKTKRKIMADTSQEAQLKKLFSSLDLDGDGVLSVAEITKAFEKSGKKIALSEVYAMIEEVDTHGVIWFKFFEC
jgi:Ca2+-binding EF-hand superfamily protein